MRRVALAFALLLTLTACSAGDESGAGGAENLRRDGGERGARRAGPAGGKPGGAAPAGAASGLTDVQVGRATIRTGAVTVRVADVQEATRAAVRVAEGAGGFVESERTTAERTVLTLRVPPEEFTGVSDAVAELGVVTDRTVSTEDATGDVADVAGRVKAARASVERVRALMGRANTISEITALEQELNEREAALESLETRRRALAGKTALASLTVTFIRPVLAAPAAARDGERTFASGLRAGWRVFTVTVAVLLVVLGAVLPFAAVALLVGVPVYLLRRRRLTARA